MKILVVEDDFVSRMVLSKMLSAYGSCDIAVNGNEALQAFDLSLEDNHRYDLICLDIMMPALDGIEVLKKIREKEKARNLTKSDDRTKIIMTTAVTQKEKVENAIKEGCDAFIVKPIIKQKLISELRNLGFLY
jgi:two-component system, chemotaxis family, chemotaxis protein CheY